MLINRVCTLTELDVQPDKKHIRYRLGVKDSLPGDAEYSERLDRQIDEMLELCRVNGAYILLPCEVQGERVRIGRGIELVSRNAARLLKNSRYIALMGSTVCKEAQNLLSELNMRDMSKAVVLNAVLAQAADAGLDALERLIARQISREGYALTKRYSPGYGDVPLGFQRDLHALTSMDALGVRITEHFMLMPEKSVLAFAGVEGIEK